MPRSRKRKIRRLEHKYRSLVFRSIVALLTVACLLFFLGFVFSPDDNLKGVNATETPFFHFGFIWTGLIFLGFFGLFILGTIRAQAEKRYGPLFWKLGWSLLFLSVGLYITIFGIRDLLI